MNKLLKILALGFLFYGVSLPLGLTETKDVSAAQEEIIHEANFSKADMLFSSANGYDVIKLKEGTMTREEGHPQLPAQILQFAVPNDKVFKNIEILEDVVEDIPGAYKIYPAQKSQRYGQPAVFTEPNAQAYASAAAYPPDIIKEVASGSLTGVDVVTVVIHPLQYNPAGKKLILHKKIRFALHFEDQTTGAANNKSLLKNSKVSPTKRSDKSKKAVQSLLNKVVVNSPTVYSEVGDTKTLTQAGGTTLAAVIPAGQTANYSGAIDYVIITSPELIASGVFTPLLNSKTAKGLNAAIESVGWIEQNFSGRDTAEKIRNYIKNLYTNNGLVWVLLGGDTNIVPTRYVTAYIDVQDMFFNDIASDMYFSDLDGDWNANNNGLWGEMADNVDLYPDVFVGRAPVEDVMEAQTFVNKVLTHQQSMAALTPAPFVKKALFLGCLDFYDAGGQVKDSIDQLYVPSEFDPITKLYERNQSAYRNQAINEINNGYLLINHVDHADYNLMYTGNDFISMADVDNLHNAPNFSVVWSVGCFWASFDGDTIAEHWLNNPNGGAVAVVGNSRFGLYPESDQMLDPSFYQVLFEQGLKQGGQTLAASKIPFLGFANQTPMMRYAIYELNFFGDPEMDLLAEDTLKIISPAVVSTGGPNVVLEYSIKQPGVVSIYDGDLLVEEATRAVGIYQYTFSQLGPRHHTLRVELNYGTDVVAAQVYYSVLLPGVTIFEPWTGSSGTPNVTVSYELDRAGTVQVFDNNQLVSEFLATVGPKTYLYSNLVPGVHNLKIKLVDTASNVFEDTIVYTVNPPANTIQLHGLVQDITLAGPDAQGPGIAGVQILIQETDSNNNVLATIGTVTTDIDGRYQTPYLSYFKNYRMTAEAISHYLYYDQQEGAKPTLEYFIPSNALTPELAGMSIDYKAFKSEYQFSGVVQDITAAGPDVSGPGMPGVEILIQETDVNNAVLSTVATLTTDSTGRYQTPYLPLMKNYRFTAQAIAHYLYHQPQEGDSPTLEYFFPSNVLTPQLAAESIDFKAFKSEYQFSGVVHDITLVGTEQPGPGMPGVPILIQETDENNNVLSTLATVTTDGAGQYQTPYLSIIKNYRITASAVDHYLYVDEQEGPKPALSYFFPSIYMGPDLAAMSIDYKAFKAEYQFSGVVRDITQSGPDGTGPGIPGVQVLIQETDSNNVVLSLVATLTTDAAGHYQTPYLSMFKNYRFTAQAIPQYLYYDPQEGDKPTLAYFLPSNLMGPDIAALSIDYKAYKVITHEPPVLGAIGNRTVAEGQPLTFVVSATDPDSTDLTYSVSGLPAGAVFSNKAFSWTPTYAQSGNYNVTFTVSDGELSDTETITIQVTNVPRADLVVSALSTTATIVARGSSFAAANTVQNAGEISAGSFKVTFHLSTDAVYGGSDDVYLAPERTITSLAAGANSAVTSTLTIPATIAVGSYYVVAKVDDANAIVELNENNNTRATTTMIQVSPGDLIVQSLVVPASAVTGGTFRLTNTVKNLGPVATTSSLVGFYLSSDAAITTGDIYVGSRSVVALASGASTTETTTLSLPASLTAGNYYVGAIVDHTNTQVEVNETNNSLAGTVMSVTPGPDLIMTVLSGPTTMTRGTTTLISHRSANNGTGTSKSFYVGLYLSVDTVITSADTWVGYVSIPGLAAGSNSGTIATSVLVPAGLAAGNYYLGAIADVTNVQVEKNETNNDRRGNVVTVK